MRSAQGGLFVSTPPSTDQQMPFAVLRCFQPSSPLDASNVTGAPHVTVLVGVDAGARVAVHVIVRPFSSTVVPCSPSPTILPTNFRSAFVASYWTGITTVSSPLANSVEVAYRTLPKRPTNAACSWLSLRRCTWSHDG